MSEFNVYKHPIRGYEAVKIGFSWPAFFFSGFWLLAKQLWGMAGIWLVLSMFLGVFDGFGTQTPRGAGDVIFFIIIILLYLTLWLIPAFNGNKWREKNLSSRGYKWVSLSQADTPDAAIAKCAKLYQSKKDGSTQQGRKQSGSNQGESSGGEDR